MKLVIIFGNGAVGKMTVGQALMKKTGLRLFHNHVMIEPVLEVFGGFNGKVTGALRQVIFEEFVKTDFEGMIFTYMWAFDQQLDWDYIMGVAEFFESHGTEVYWVELVASQEVRLQRNRTENRMLHKASKRNLEFSESCIMQEDSQYRLESLDGELKFENYIKINNTNLEPDEVADMIVERFLFEQV